MDEIMMQSATKPIIIVEMNEFNIELLKAATSELKLGNLNKMLNFHRATYKTNDHYDSGYLEPWVQWVSIHSGQSSQKHKIKHLGDVPDLKFQQFWQTLGKNDISTGIWGVMNGARLNAPKNLFFLPDPWTFSEKAYPRQLNQLLELPQYLTKNYCNKKMAIMMIKIFRLLKFVLFSGKAKPIIRELMILRKDIKNLGSHHYIYITWFDYVSTLLFSQYQKRYNPSLSIIFLNSLAHIQHHYWRDGECGITSEIAHAYKNMDRILGFLFKTFPEHSFIMHNGLSQMNTNHEKPWILYRQKDPFSFLTSIGLNPERVEQNMTHDGHAFFKTPQEIRQAVDALKGATILGKNLFHIETYEHDNLKLFYRLDFTDELPTDANFIIDTKRYVFFEHFDKIVKRTGKHVPFGSIFSQHIKFADHIFNHNFNDIIYHYFRPDLFNFKAEYTKDRRILENV